MTGVHDAHRHLAQPPHAVQVVIDVGPDDFGEELAVVDHVASEDGAALFVVERCCRACARADVGR